jgi:hypothetical protein
MKLLGNSMKIAALAAQLLGGVITLIGAYSLSGGTEIIPIDMLNPQEAGQIFSGVGIVILFLGVVLFYFGFRPSRLSLSSVLFGLCSFAIPVILFALSYNLIAAGFLIIFGYLFLATIFIWLSS